VIVVQAFSLPFQRQAKACTTKVTQLPVRRLSDCGAGPDGSSPPPVSTPLEPELRIGPIAVGGVEGEDVEDLSRFGGRETREIAEASRVRPLVGSRSGRVGRAPSSRREQGRQTCRGAGSWSASSAFARRAAAALFCACLRRWAFDQDPAASPSAAAQKEMAPGSGPLWARSFGPTNSAGRPRGRARLGLGASAPGASRAPAGRRAQLRALLVHQRKQVRRRPAVPPCWITSRIRIRVRRLRGIQT